MVKIVATRCHILKLKCPEFDFVWGSAPDPAGGAQVHYSPRPPSWILAVLLIREGKGKEDGLGMGGKSEVKGKGDRGGRKGKAGGKGESAEGDRKEGRGMDGISLPHGRLRSQDLGSTGTDLK